ncbi:MAG: hypothetical protein R3223_05590 [Longimicrobiales bacterium]|nr:hypothetical protein [Longimicrobiales bacterium]
MERSSIAVSLVVALAFVSLPAAASGQHEGHGQTSDTTSSMMDRMMERMHEMHGGEGDGGMAGGMGSDRGGMSGGMGSGEVVGPGPARILGMVEELDLSAEQIARLGQIRERLATVREEETAAATEAGQAAGLALEGETPNFDAYEEALRRRADHHVRIQVATARAAVEARQVLTASQIDQLEAAMAGGMSHSGSGGDGNGRGGGTGGGGGGGHSH